MQLTPLQLEIQKRADKTPSIGCLFTSSFFSEEESAFIICDRRDNLTPSSAPYGRFTPEHMKPKPGEHRLCTSDMRQGSITFARAGYKEIINIYASDKCQFDWGKFTDAMHIIGHPMTRGRLNYLYGKYATPELYKIWLGVLVKADVNIKLFDETILERPEYFQLLVKAFLDTLPKQNHE